MSYRPYGAPRELASVGETGPCELYRKFRTKSDVRSRATPGPALPSPALSRPSS